MATATNNFNTGLAAGTTITTTNSADNGAGNAFDALSSGGTKTYETRDAGLYGRFTSVGSGMSYCEYSTTVGTVGVGNPVYGSADILIPTLPAGGSGGTRIAVVTTAADGFIAEWRINDTGKLEQRTGAGGLRNTSTASITAGQWFKVHVSILNLSDTTGQLQCRLFLDPTSNTPTETLTTTADQNLGSTSAAKYRFGTTRNLTDFATGVDNVRWSTTSEAPVEAGILIGPVCGALTDDGFTVSYRTSDSAGLDHRLVVSTTSDLATSPVFSSPVQPDADGFVKLTVSGLNADTLYYYGVEIDAVLLSLGRGQVVTDPTPGVAANYSVAFGSCQYDVPTAVTFDAIKDYTGTYGQVRRLIHMGDLNYQDWTTGDTAADMIAQHQTSLASASMKDMLAEIAMTYTWDNHDWGGSFSDKNNPVGATVASVLRQVFPHYPLPASDGKGIWHTWMLGRVRFIQLDVRSQRDPYNAPNGPSKTMLGVEQKAWLKTQLQDSAPVKIICGNMFWREGSVNGDRWGSYPDEFDELNDFIDASANGLVYVIFGDRHALCADNGSTLTAGQSTRGRPQAGGAPFQQGSTGISETWSAGYYDDPVVPMQAFGLLHITDDGSTITIDYEGKTSADLVTRVAMTTVVDTDQGVIATSVAPRAAVGTPTGGPGQYTATATSVPSGLAFGTPTVTPGPVTVTATGVGSTVAFGTPTVTSQLTLQPTAVASGLAFGRPTATTGPVTVTATGVTGAEAFGLPQVTPGPVTITVPGIGSNLAFGVPLLADNAQDLHPTGVASSVGFGLATISAPQFVEPSSVDPTGAVGSPYVYTGPVTVRPVGVGSVLDFGTPTVAVGQVTVVAASVASGLAWGLPSVAPPAPPGQTVSATSVVSGLVFGLPGTIIGSVSVRATSVPPLAALGTPSSATGPVTLVAAGIATGLAFGDTHIIGGNDGQVVSATSVPSGEAFGADVLAFLGGGGNDCECAVLVGH